MLRMRRQAKWCWIVVAIIATTSGSYAYWYTHRYKHFAVHESGMVYRSAWVEPDVFSELIEKHQIRTIINLCEPGEMGDARWDGQRAAVRGAGAQLLELPMPRTINAEDPAVTEYLDVLKNPDNYPLLVHCQHGVTRTAKLLALYDIAFRGMSARDSLQRMPLFGRRDHNVAVKAFATGVETTYHEKAEQLARHLDPLHQVH